MNRLVRGRRPGLAVALTAALALMLGGCATGRAPAQVEDEARIVLAFEAEADPDLAPIAEELRREIAERLGEVDGIVEGGADEPPTVEVTGNVERDAEGAAFIVLAARPLTAGARPWSRRFPVEELDLAAGELARALGGRPQGELRVRWAAAIARAIRADEPSGDASDVERARALLALWPGADVVREMDPAEGLEAALRVARTALVLRETARAREVLRQAREAWESLGPEAEDEGEPLFELERAYRERAGLAADAGRDCTGATALHAAAERGDRAAVARLLAEGAEPLAVNHQGETALHRAARAGHVEVVRLLARDADQLAAVDDFGRTPLTSAIRAGHGAAAEVLLAAGAPVGARTRDMRTPLHEAARLGQRDMVQRLARRAAVDALDIARATPLGAAVETGALEAAAALLAVGAAIDGVPGATPPLAVVAQSTRARDRTAGIRWLVAAGANVDARDILGRTPLHAAVQQGHTDATAALVALGASLDARDESGATPLTIAVRASRLEILRDLIARSGKDPIPELLVVAVEHDRLEAFRLLLGLLERSAVYELDGRGRSPSIAAALEEVVLAAVARDADAYVRALLDRGLPASARDAAGETLLHLAARHGSYDVARLLLEHRADPRARHRGLTPLEWALVQPLPSADMLRLLAGPGDVGAWAWLGDLTRLRAALQSDPRAATRLGPDGLGAIHHAARAGRPAAVALLLARGASPTLGAKDVWHAPEVAGWTPMHFAFAGGAPEVVGLLLDAGARPDAEDARGRPAWWFASVRGREAFAALVARVPELADGSEPDVSLPAPEELLVGREQDDAHASASADPIWSSVPIEGFGGTLGVGRGFAGHLGVQLRPDPPELMVLRRDAVQGRGHDEGTAAEGLEQDLDVCRGRAAFVEARRVARDLLAERRDPDTAEPALVGLAEHNLGAIEVRLGDLAAARSAYERALALLPEHDETTAQVRPIVLENLAEVPWIAGDHAAAIATLEQALALRRRAADDPYLARPLILLGMAYTDQGRYAQAVAALREALSSLPPPASDGARATEAGGGTVVGGIMRLATIDIVDDDAVATRSGLSWYAHNNLAVLLDAFGDHDGARALTRAQLEAVRALKEPPALELAVAEHNMALHELRVGALAEARALTDAAIERLSRAHPQHWVLGRLLLGQGHVARAGGDLDRATTAYAEARAALARSHGEAHGHVADALRHQALVALQRGDHAGGRRALVEAWRIASQAHAPEIRWPIELALGRVEAASGRLGAAILFGKQAVETLQAMRRDAAGAGKALEAGFVEDRIEAWRTLADWLAQAGRLAEAAQVIDLLKEEEVESLVVRGQGDGPGPAGRVRLRPDEARAREALERQAGALAAAGAEYDALLRLKRTTGLDAAAQKRLVALEQVLADASDAFERYLQEVDEEVDTLSRQRARDIDELNLRDTSARQATLRQLGHGAVLLHYLVMPDRLRILVTTPSVQVGRTVDVKARELNRLVFVLRQALADPRSDVVPAARELHALLIDPIAADLRAARAETLMVSLDGALRYVPLAALHDGERWLVERFRVALFSSAAVDKLTEPPRRGGRVAAFGASQRMEGLAELREVPRELEGIVKHDARDADGVLPGDVWLDDAFTREAMQEAIRSGAYTELHIASHFIFDPPPEANETEPYLVMPKDRFRLADVRRQNLDGIQLLSLSACNTAVAGVATSGDAAAGREVESLATWTLKRGVRGVVATLWPVADRSTAELMRALYAIREQDETMTRADALRLAQLRFIRGTDALPAEDVVPRGPRPFGPPEAPPTDAAGATSPARWSHPYYWAPFVLIGNWL
ncbi:MAG: ankyrin repeat domain-containing protein [Deltaproteobacteria bacterium]|nr:ankyrin repeat domain-containing protein [Deltaproteobacteria bacterium]